MAYLSEYLGEKKIDSSITAFYKNFRLKPKVTALDFRKTIERFSNKDITGFLKNMWPRTRKFDFTINKIEKTEDSISLTIKNKRGTNVPISLFGLQKDSVVSQYWFYQILTPPKQ